MKDDLLEFIEYVDGNQVPEYIKDMIKVIEENHNNDNFRVGITGRGKSCLNEWLELVEAVNNSKALSLNADFLVLDEDRPSIKQMAKQQEDLALFRKGVKRGKFL